MAMETGIIDGGLLRLHISSDDGTTYKIGYTDQSADLSITASLKDTKSKDDGVWNSSSPGTYSWSISGEKLFAVSASTDVSHTESDIIIDDLLMLMIPDFNGTGQPDCATGKESKLVKIKYATPNSFLNEGWFYEGEGYITDISISAGNAGENATASYTITGIGPLTKTVTP